MPRTQTAALIPLADQILIEPRAADSTSAGGIIIPDNAQQRSQCGVVVATGKGRKLENGELWPCEVEIGDTVFFRRFSGSELEIEGREMVVLREADVLGVVRGE